MRCLGLYTQIAETAPTSFPPVQAEPLSGLSGELGLLGEKNEFYPQLDNLIKRETGPGSKSGRYLNRALIPSSERTRMAFAEAYRFYDRPGTRDPAGPKEAPQRPSRRTLIFTNFAASAVIIRRCCAGSDWQ